MGVRHTNAVNREAKTTMVSEVHCGRRGSERWRGVRWRRLGVVSLAPRWRSRSAKWSFPRMKARCNGVLPSMLVTLWSAECRSRSLVMGVWMEIWSGVFPSRSVAWTFAPRRMR